MTGYGPTPNLIKDDHIFVYQFSNTLTFQIMFVLKNLKQNAKKMRFCAKVKCFDRASWFHYFSLNVDENPPPTPPPAAVVDETLEKELEKLENENEELEEQPEDGIIDDDKPEENDPAEESATEIKEEDDSNNPEEVLTSG